MTKVINGIVVNEPLEDHIVDGKMSLGEAIKWCFKNRKEWVLHQDGVIKMRVTDHGGLALNFVKGDNATYYSQFLDDLDYKAQWSIVDGWKGCTAPQALMHHQEGKKTRCRGFGSDWIDGIKTVAMEDADKFEWAYQV